MQSIRSAAVLVVGCGALGSLAAMYLAASGVGTVGIADFDTIDISNLQRQLFFSENELGQQKCSVLASKIKAINSDVNLRLHQMMITPANASQLFEDYDFILDCSDNAATKLLVESAARCAGKCCCIAGVSGFSGQVMSIAPDSVSFSEVFGSDADDSMLPCGVAGVVGPAAGVISSIQAAEAIKHIAGCGDMLFNRVLFIDLLSMQSSVLPVG